MAQGFTNAGERLLLSQLFQTGTVEVTIYNDTSDTITHKQWCKLIVLYQ